MADPLRRVAMYTHDTFGMGHIRRCLHIARELAEKRPETAILFVTGSPALTAFRDLPPHLDVVKIPVVARTGGTQDRPSHLPLPLEDVTRLRSRLAREAVLEFDPEVLLVDNFPLGSRRELLPLLEDLRNRRTRTVLGVRDVLDDPEVVKRDWARQGMVEVLDRCFDRILVYGMKDVLDAVQAYDLPPAVASRVRYCGYVTGPSSSGSTTEMRSSLGLDDRPFLLATGGGGGDGFPLLHTFLEAFPLLPQEQALVVTGPLMSVGQQDALRRLASGHPGIKLLTFLPDLRALFSEAEVVVSMCGYNTATELVDAGARAALVPRTWRYGEFKRGISAGAEAEQLLRAQALERMGLARVLDPQDLNPERLAAHVRDAETLTPRGSILDLGGRVAVVKELISMSTEGGVRVQA